MADRTQQDSPRIRKQPTVLIPQNSNLPPIPKPPVSLPAEPWWKDGDAA